MKPAIILASGSPRRQQLMRQFGYEVEIQVPDIEETSQDEQTPWELAQENANIKAAAIADQFPDSLILAADTVVDVDGEVFGKPADPVDALRMLRILQGRIHQVVTAVRLEHRSSQKSCEFQDFSRVRFHSLSDEAIRKYLNDVQPWDKAGAYAAQKSGEQIIAQIEGSLTNVIGLPMERLSAVMDMHFPEYLPSTG